jgi:hypothetical protein
VLLKSRWEHHSTASAKPMLLVTALYKHPPTNGRSCIETLHIRKAAALQHSTMIVQTFSCSAIGLDLHQK